MHFLNPYGALYSLTLIPIILFYFLKQEKLLVEVSSLIPWRELSEASSSERKRFKLEILFLLQLLVIFILVLALIRFYVMSNVKVSQRIFILDTSASMLTQEEGGTRLAQAKLQAAEMVENMSDKERIMLIRAGAYPQRLTPFLGSKAKLKRAINELQGLETSAQLQDALQLAISSAGGTANYKITIFTDHEEPGLKELAGERNLEFRIVGEQENNVAITAMDVYQGLYDYSQHKVYISLRNFSPRSQNVGLRIYQDQKPLWEKRLTLLSGEAKTLTFGHLKQPGLLKAQLVIDDALETDNVAYALVAPNKLIRLLVVTADQKLAADLKRIAKTIPGMELTLIAPEQYTSGLTRRYDMAIFQRFVPGVLPRLNALYVMPPLDNTAFTVKSVLMDKPRIMDWNREHPALKYLNFLDEVPLKEVLHLEPPDWASVLIEAQNFPLAWEGEYHGQRFICLGFELGDYLFTASQDVTMVVMLLNMLDWLTPQPASLAQLRTGEKYVLQYPVAIKEASIINPRGEEIELPTDQTPIGFSATDYVGVYELSALDVQGNRIKRRFVANLLDEVESSIAPTVQQEPIPAGSNAGMEGVLTQEQLEFWPYIILMALLFIFIEWWVYFRRLS
jgi:hypothetical protein